MTERIIQARYILLIAVLAAASVSGQFEVSRFEPASPQQFAGYGRSLAAVGDIDMDGFSDLLVGAPTEDAGGFVDAGRVYAVSGGDGTQRFVLDSPNPQQSGTFGFTLAAADLTGDGISDLLIGSQEAVDGLDGAGRVYAFNGSNGAPLYSVASPNPEQFGWFSRSLATIGDIDGDGISDWAAGCDESSGGIARAGRIYLLSGVDGSVLLTVNSPNPNENGLFGLVICNVGDVNGDGRSDLLCGTRESTPTATQAGRAYLISGADGAMLHQLDTPHPENNGRFGWSVAAAGDVNNDGVIDWMVGSAEDTGGFVDAGRVYLFSGTDADLLASLAAPAPFHGDGFGRSLSSAGDVDGDGHADLLIGAPMADADGITDAGRVYLMSGATGLVMDSLFSPAPEFGGLFGFAVSGEWNSTASGTFDALLSGYAEDVAGILDAGRIYRFRSTGVSPIFPAAIVPETIHLRQNYPNPFNPETHLEFGVGSAEWANLTVFDVLGRAVRTLVDEQVSAGRHVVRWDGRNDAGRTVTSGTYFYRLTAGGATVSKRMLLMR